MDFLSVCPPCHDVLFSNAEAEFDVAIRSLKGDESVVSTLHSLARGDRDLLLKLIHQVCSVNRLDIDALKAAVEERDREMAAKCLHKMSGAACVLKCKSMAQYCGFVESACANEPWPVLIELSKKVEWLIYLLDQSLIDSVSDM